MHIFLVQNLSFVVGLAACGLGMCLSNARGDDRELKADERIIFLGDSITQGGAAPGGYVTLVREALEKNRKELGVEVIGAGISGNKVPDLERRLQRDVLAKKPTRVIIYIGINDVWHWKSGRGTSKEDYEKGLRSLVQQIREAGAQVVLCTASVIGEKADGTNPMDRLLDEYCEISRKVAVDTKTPLLDLRRAFLDHLKQHNAQNLEKSVLTTDGVHLNAAGNQFVAQQMLVALGLNQAAQSGVLRHMVLVKFKEDLNQAQVQEVVDAFRALPGKIDSIQDFEYGTDNSPEMLAAGFTHCFLLTFADEKGRDAYLPHAAHEEFKKLAIPRIEKVLVVDYWTKE